MRPKCPRWFLSRSTVDMISNNYGLNGKLKIDTYSKDNKLIRTTDWVDNFITSTGLNYLFYLSPADCFRFVSLGSGNTANTILGLGTTGLEIGAPSYMYIGGAADSQGCNNRAGSDFNFYSTNGCGYRIEGSGVVLNRAWKVPTGETFFSGTYNFKEYMLSPSCEAVTGKKREFGFESVATIPTGICDCGSYGVYDYTDGTTNIYGHENYELYNFYKDRTPSFDLCRQGKYAFARIIKDITVGLNEYIIINYALTVSYNTGVQSFSLAAQVPDVVPDVAGGQDMANWGNAKNISGIYSLVHPGIKLVNGDEDAPYTYGVTDIRTQYAPEVGESFVPPLGNTFESACTYTLIKSYISSDILQFLVNDLSGAAMHTGSYKPYAGTGRAFPSGVLSFHKNWIADTTQSNLGDKLQTATYFPHYTTPRSSWPDSYSLAAFPNNTDYRTAALSTEVLDGSYTPIILESLQGSFDIQPYSLDDRSRNIIRSFQFLDYTLDEPFPVRSLVIAYDSNQSDIVTDIPRYFPFIDLIFYPTSGTGYIDRLPYRDSGNFAYHAPLNRINSITIPQSSGYSFMNDTNKLTMQFRVSWSSPCSSEVVGCV